MQRKSQRDTNNVHLLFTTVGKFSDVNKQICTSVSLTLYLLQGAEHSLLIHVPFMILLHGFKSVLRVLAAAPLELVLDQVLRFEHDRLLEL